MALAGKGIKTGQDFADLMGALMSDLATNRIDPRAANAMCNAGGKLLKVVEMQRKYGLKEGQDAVIQTLKLTS